MKKILFPAFLLVAAVTIISCSNPNLASSPSSATIPNVSGSWEFILNSTTQPGYSTGLEAALQEGQTLNSSSGIYTYNGQISASGAQLNFVGFTPSNQIVFGGNCTPAADNTGNTLTGSISGTGGSMNFSFTESGNEFSVTATLDPSGTFIDSGTYTAQSGSTCTDSGTISSGMIVPKLSGMYSGSLLVNENTDNATATLSESSSNLTMDLVLTGADNTTLSLTGPVTGNEFQVQGTYQGIALTYYGYFEATTQTLYLSTTANPSQKAGLLTVQQ